MDPTSPYSVPIDSKLHFSGPTEGSFRGHRCGLLRPDTEAKPQDYVSFNSSLSPGPAVLLGHELISRPGLHSPCKHDQNKDNHYSKQRSEFRDDVGVLKCIKLGSEASRRETKRPFQRDTGLVGPHLTQLRLRAPSLFKGFLLQQTVAMEIILLHIWSTSDRLAAHLVIVQASTWTDDLAPKQQEQQSLWISSFLVYKH